MQKFTRANNGIRRVDLAYARLASSEVARTINRDIILQLIRTQQPISRADLSRMSGLQRSTVSQIIEQLIEEQWVKQGALVKVPRGRQPTMLALNDDLVVLAADIHPRRAAVAMVDLSGRILSQTVLTLSSNPNEFLSSLVKYMKRIREDYPRKTPEGIGISVPGRVDSTSQRLIFAANLKWRDLDIKRDIARGTSLPVEMENAATASLMSELWFGRLDGVRDAVLITISEGIGAGIMANGNLISGQYGMAGEFGHVSLDPSGPLCACKQKGCWETLASSNAALRYYNEMVSKPRRITFSELIGLADGGDRQASAALERQAIFIGAGLRMVTAALSPKVILLAGDITSAWGRSAPVIEKEMAKLTLAGKPPRLQPLHGGEDARLRGAAAIFLQRNSLHNVRPHGLSNNAELRGMPH